MAETMNQLAAQVAHSVDLQRLANSIARGENAEYDNLARFIRELLLDYDVINSKKLRDELIKQITAEVAATADNVTASMLSQIDDVIRQEVNFQWVVLRNISSKKPIKPKLDAVSRAILNQPLVLNGKGLTWEERIGAFKSNQVQAAKQIIMAGWSNGQTTNEISRQLIGTRTTRGVIDQSKSAANALVKDLISHSSSVTKSEVARQNDDIIIGEKAIVTLDSRTSPICQDYGSQDKGGKEWFYKEDGRNFPRPPFHYRCLVEGTKITSAYGVSSVSKRKFKGTLVTITTAKGNVLTVTPNHPILTARGWVCADEINKSDKVVSQSCRQGVADINWDNDQVETRVEDIFSSFGSSFEVSTSEVPTSTPDFHGDGTDNEVAIVRSKRLLLGEFISNINKKIPELNFQVGDGGEVFLSGNSSSAKFLYGMLSASGSIMRSSSEVSDLFGGCPDHSGELLLRPVTWLESSIEENLFTLPNTVTNRLANGGDANTVIKHVDDLRRLIGFWDSYPSICFGDPKLPEQVVYASWRDTELISNNLATYAGGVELDDVVDLAFAENVSTHVYNLETVDGCYCAEGILTHNCRTTNVFIINKEYDLEIETTRPAVVDGKAIQVDSKTDWLTLAKRYPSIAEQALGKTRAKLIDEMSVDAFQKIAFNSLNQYNTIDEMVANSKKVAGLLKA
jgi:hypothetical protein